MYLPFSAASSWYLARKDAAVSRELATVGDLESLKPPSEGIDDLQLCVYVCLGMWLVRWDQVSRVMIREYVSER
jgi:hypothetical protein